MIVERTLIELHVPDMPHIIYIYIYSIYFPNIFLIYPIIYIYIYFRIFLRQEPGVGSSEALVLVYRPEVVIVMQISLEASQTAQLMAYLRNV